MLGVFGPGRSTKLSVTLLVSIARLSGFRSTTAVTLP